MPRSVLTFGSAGASFIASSYHLIASSYCSASKYRFASCVRGAGFDASRSATFLRACTCDSSTTAARLPVAVVAGGETAASAVAAAGGREVACCAPMIQPTIRPKMTSATAQTTLSDLMAQARHHGGHGGH